ncbi:MAG: peptidoglycan-binding protein [Sporolactobacillus sp.]
MNAAETLAKGVAIAATFSSTFFILPHGAAAQFIANPMVLQKGMHGEAVRTVQSILKAVGNYPLSTQTGYFGSTTETAVQNYQKATGLEVTGTVDRPTQQSLIASVHRQMGLMSIGASGENVRYLQQFLTDLGYYSGNDDGIFGVLTRTAVLRIQQTTHIAVDGIVGPETWGSIEKLTSDKLHAEASPAASSAPTAPQSPDAAALTATASAQPAAAPAQPAAPPNVQPAVSTVREFYANSTAYTAHCNGCSGTTATGINLIQNPDAKVVAVDPSVIPLGTKLYVEGYGYAVAADTGGAIKGQKIDLFFNSNADALQWGRRTVKVQILSK